MDSNIKLATKYLENAQNSAIRMLAEYIQDHGGIINLSYSENKDNIYGYVWVGDVDYPVDECHVNCIYYDEKYETIYLHTCEQGETYEDFDEIKDDNDNWYPLNNHEMLVVPTLYSILEAIEEYVE